MFIKIFFLIIVFLNLKLPLNNELDIFVLFLAFFILFFVSKTQINNLKYKINYFFIIIFLTFLNLFIPKFFSEELHQVFINTNDIEIISKIFPDKINTKLKFDFDNNFDSSRLVKSHDWSKKEIQKRQFIKNNFAYSVDAFFQNNRFSRINSEINFSSREELRIGKINSLDYNLPYDKQLRRILPYIVLFELGKIFDGSKICHQGNIFIAQNNKKILISDIKNLDFKQQNQKNCIDLDFKKNYFYILGYSINEKDNLIIKTEYNFKILLLKFLKYFLTILIIIIFGYANFKKNRIIYPLIYLVSSISTIILTYIRDPNLLFGLRFYRGGADGLLHYSHGRDIVQNLNNYNFFEALKGGEEIFYFMPGLRYFSSINNLLFGETTYGYLISCTFIPLIIYLIFEKLINKKIAIILFISFIFIPIFENMGFGFFNYIWQFARHHAESLSILFLLYAFYLFISITKKLDKNKPIFLLGLFLSMSVFLRPNFLPTTFIFFTCSFFILAFRRDYKNLILNILGYSLIFISLIHNLYFGNSAILFTKADANFKLDLYSFFNGFFSLFTLDFNNSNLQILKSQLSLWNPLYNLHRVIILILITFMIFYKKQSLIIYTLFLCIVSQHGLLLLSHPSSRYAYLAWLLTFIMFVYYLFNFYLKKLK